MTEPCDLAATEARRLIGRRALSPVELLRSCLGRIGAVDHAINAMVALDTERAEAAARAAEAAVMRGDRLGPLHGLPLGIKDTEDTAGLRTTYGSPIFRDQVPARDAHIVASLRQAGGIVAGKTNVPEFAAGANTRNPVYGATGNPFDPTRSAAGSSGGSAAALATGMVPLATGSDMGGSLRNPAAYCGIVGFRPSAGLVPSDKRPLGWSNLSVLGPMARNVPDLCLMLSAMASDDAGDPLAYTVQGRLVRTPGEFHPVPGVDLATLRVAATEDFGFAPTERAIRRVFAARAGALSPLFGRLEHAHPNCDGADEAFEILRAGIFLASHLEKVRTRRAEVGPNIVANVEEGLRYTLADGARAAALQTALYRRWQAFFRDHDVLISPAITLSPRPWSELYPAEIDGEPTRTYFHWLALAYAVTLAGHPAISLPVGRDEAGMPFGLQIVGPRGGDALVLGVAAALEAALAGDPALARPVPDLAALRAAGPIAAMPGFDGWG
ncbi:amidase family protein [Roseomonas sp. NAR14]|uniref:Amidase family protein n=1 Tax=Roseomonas acroporae TaxID=2937791 RepID=A0A9X2BWA6_9PROT|nr:amidase family protein [Roseomonas acroporae]MCK8783675.1 amidase family protein [Roseomonas acroporae]